MYTNKYRSVHTLSSLIPLPLCAYLPWHALRESPAGAVQSSSFLVHRAAPLSKPFLGFEMLTDANFFSSSVRNKFIRTKTRTETVRHIS